MKSARSFFHNHLCVLVGVNMLTENASAENVPKRSSFPIAMSGSCFASGFVPAGSLSLHS